MLDQRTVDPTAGVPPTVDAVPRRAAQDILPRAFDEHLDEVPAWQMANARSFGARTCADGRTGGGGAPPAVGCQQAVGNGPLPGPRVLAWLQIVDGDIAVGRRPVHVGVALHSVRDA